MAPAVAINLITGKIQPFLGILDTGADSTVLTKEVLIGLEIPDDLLEEQETGGAHGYKSLKFCKYIKIGLVAIDTREVYYPNHDGPVPAYFSSESAFDLLGQNSFLNLCKSTFDGRNGLVSIEV